MNRTLASSVLGAVLLVSALAGCSSGGGGDSDGDSGGSVASDVGAAREADGVAAEAQPQALIKKGNVALRADDVAGARTSVQRVVDTYDGQVTDEKTQSDDDGDTTYARLVVRVPSADFSQAVDDLKGVGELESASTNEDDVTDQVIDVRTRLRVQQRSIARITVLFDRAEDIRDIMAIEAQLSQRQADLESLKQQAAYLANQTSLSTIVVSIDQEPAAATPKDDDSGFLAGLAAGWDALATFAVGLATVAGAVLPWAVVVAAIGLPTLLLVRSLRRRTAKVAPADAQSSE